MPAILATFLTAFLASALLYATTAFAQKKTAADVELSKRKNYNGPSDSVNDQIDKAKRNIELYSDDFDIIQNSPGYKIKDNKHKSKKANNDKKRIKH